MKYSKNFEKVNNAENIDDFEKKFSYHESVNFVIKFILKCIKYQKKFYFNNKLHKHFRQCNKITKTKSKKNFLTAVHVTTHIFVVKSINKLENYHEFAFKIH